MKYNAKFHINIEEMVDGFISRLNNDCELQGIKKLYEVTIKNGTYKSDTAVNKSSKVNKPFKTIVYSVVDLETRFKTVLYSTDYRVKNPAELLTTNWRKKMYGELLYNCLLGYGMLAEQQLLEERMRVSPVEGDGGVDEEGIPLKVVKEGGGEDMSHLSEVDYQAWLKENNIVEGEEKLSNKDDLSAMEGALGQMEKEIDTNG